MKILVVFWSSNSHFEAKNHPPICPDFLRHNTGAQWHVGNHHYDIPEKEDTTEEMDDEGELDHKPYDEVVLWKLLDIADAAVSANLCEENDQNKIKEELDNLCKKIKSSLDDFKINPKKSKPYYVSKWAMAYKG